MVFLLHNNDWNQCDISYTCILERILKTMHLDFW